jgi:preprotein translocase subunit SecY
MISAFANIFKIPELRQRVLFTLGMIVIMRIGAAITAPGVNAMVLRDWFLNAADHSAGGGAAALFNLFSGGALGNCAIFSLGIMPYISASIMLQLLGAVVPRLGRLAREDGGRQKIAQWTRYTTILLCVFQGYLLALSFESPGSNPFLTGITQTIDRLGIPLVSDPGYSFRILTVLIMTAGTLFLMWMGDQITERGVGNGISVIITVGILAQLPAGLVQAWRTFVPTAGDAANVSPVVLVILCAFLFIVIASVIAVTQATRRISVQYAKRVVGRKVYGGQTQYMPLKVNYAGVMPIIFAQAILMFPSQILSMAFGQKPWAVWWANQLNGGWIHYSLYALLIFSFSYFWVATQFQPAQIADDLKKNGGFIPGVRPGQPTASFLDYTMGRLTFAGALFLVIIAILPQLISRGLNVPYMAAQFFGGTGLLIIVGVILDTMRQVETFLLQRHYDGFLRKGKLRGRSGARPSVSGSAVSDTTLIWFATGLGLLIIAGMAIAITHHR